MTKFEEEAIKEAQKSEVIATSYDDEFTAYDIGLNIKLERGTYNFPWLEFAKNWHSDEEFQELLDKYSSLNDNYEKEVIKSSKLESQLISREKQVIELREADKAQGKEIIQLKSQLQQQALPVVPEDVDEWIEILKTKGLKPLKNPETYEETGFTEETLQDIVFWISEHQEDYMRAWLDGYTVEKPQLFYLKHIDMSKSDAHLNWYLAKGTDNVLIHQGIKKGKSPKLKCILKLTQQEIDSMQTGSYEQIHVPVEDGE